jgi:hypothetical protein
LELLDHPIGTGESAAFFTNVHRVISPEDEVTNIPKLVEVANQLQVTFTALPG